MSERMQMDLAWRMHDAATAAIDKAETKAGFAATLDTALAAVALTLVSRSHGSPLGARITFGVALAALAVALGSALLVVLPRMCLRADALVPGELLGFGAVRAWSPEKVADPLVAVTDQANRLADIAWAKHRWLHVSFAAATAGAMCTVAGVLIGGAR